MTIILCIFIKADPYCRIKIWILTISIHFHFFARYLLCMNISWYILAVWEMWLFSYKYQITFQMVEMFRHMIKNYFNILPIIPKLVAFICKLKHISHTFPALTTWKCVPVESPNIPTNINLWLIINISMKNKQKNKKKSRPTWCNLYFLTSNHHSLVVNH